MQQKYNCSAVFQASWNLQYTHLDILVSMFLTPNTDISNREQQQHRRREKNTFINFHHFLHLTQDLTQYLHSRAYSQESSSADLTLSFMFIISCLTGNGLYSGLRGHFKATLIKITQNISDTNDIPKELSHVKLGMIHMKLTAKAKHHFPNTL